MPSLTSRAVDVDGHRGLVVRPRAARALFVLAHGAGAGMEHSFMTALAAGLAGEGIATLRWEFLNRSAGKKRPDPAPVAEDSVRRVWAASKRIARGLPRFAGGKSFGGRMSSRAHASTPLPELRGLIFVGFPLHPPKKPGPKMEGPGFTPGPGTERADHLDGATGPLLFLQGTRDDLADLALLRPVISRLGPRATLHIVEGADHGFSRKPDVPELAATIAEWIVTNLDSA